MGAGKGKARRARSLAPATGRTATAPEPPMGIKGASISWDTSMGRKPLLILKVENVPDYSKVVHKIIGFPGSEDVLLFGENEEGYVHFVLHSPGHEDGALDGVAKVEDEAGDVSEYRYAGAWSSRASAVNSLGCSPCLEVEFDGGAKGKRRGHLTVAAASAAMKKYQLEAVLEEEPLSPNSPNDIIYVPHHRPVPIRVVEVDAPPRIEF